MKKVNFEVMLRIIILLGFSVFYSVLVGSNKITLYVHPRIVPFAKVSILVMLLIVMFLIFDIVKARTVRRKLKNYIIFIIPFVMMLGMKPDNTNASSSNKSSFLENKADDLKSTQSNNNSNKVANDTNKNTSNNGEDKKASIDKDGIIKVTDSNYINFLTEVENNTDNYINKEVEIVGFIYREDGMNNNEFALVRNMMVCCTADMQMVGFLCENGEAVKFDPDTWLKVNGTIEKQPDGKEVMIKVKKMEKVDAPKSPYVYPY